MKKTFSLLLAIALGALLVGCASEPQPEATPDTSKAAAKFETGGSEGAANAAGKSDTATTDQ